jgi:hypothetical protein
VCQYEQLPAYKWGSATDQTGRLPGLTCVRLEKPLPGGSLKGWLEWSKIAQLIESLP